MGQAGQTGETVSAEAPRLEVRGLTRGFGGRPVVEDLSFSVAPGQITCLLGPSGCGKSTTLRMIAGIERPDRGEVMIDGRCVSGADVFVPPERRGVGFMFQDFALFPHLDVAGNIGFGLPRGMSGRGARISELLERVGLKGFEHKYPHELSGGEQQRVALARALAPRPRVMLMDEPFSGLDNRLRDEVRDHALELLKAEGAAVVLVTHEPEEAMRMADEIALMRDGRLIQRGAPYNVYNAPADRQAAAFFSDVNVIRGVVQGALVSTPFGEFLAPGHPDGTEVEIVVRPQHVGVDFWRGGMAPAPTPERGVPARGVVRRARFLGEKSLVEFDLDGLEGPFRVSVPGVFLPATGRPFWLTLRRDRCFVFPVRGEGVASRRAAE